MEGRACFLGWERVPYLIMAEVKIYWPVKDLCAGHLGIYRVYRQHCISRAHAYLPDARIEYGSTRAYAEQNKSGICRNTKRVLFLACYVTHYRALRLFLFSWIPQFGILSISA